jgi:PAS domain S-box-containing protein
LGVTYAVADRKVSTVPLGKLRLRAILALLVLVITVPLALFAGILIARSSNEQRALVESRNVETARAVSVAVDQSVESARAALQALAATDVLDQPDRVTFNAMALRLVPTQPGWYAVLLVHPSGAVMADTALGAETAPSFTTADWVRSVLAARRPVVSNLFEDAAAGGHFFVVAVPVVRSGEIRSVLAAQIRTTSLSEILRRQNVPSHGVITLIDGALHIMARTRGEAQYIGRAPSADFVAAASRMSEGSWRSTMLEGMPVYASLSRSPVTGWTVGIGIPVVDMESAIRRSIWALVLAGTVILGGGVAGALVLSSFIVRALASAATSARALARGERVIAVPSRISEADELSTGLLEAAQILDARIRERDQALLAERIARSASEKDEARLAVTLRSIGDAVITTDPEGLVTMLNPVAHSLTGRSEAVAIGQPIESVFQIIEEEARERVENPIRKVLREGRIVAGGSDHLMLIASDGRETPIEETAAPIRSPEGTLIGIVLVFRDASDRRDSERRRHAILQREQEARREAEALNRSKDDFVATVSHELRTPLNAIFGWVRLLRTGKLNESEHEHALEVVERNTRAQAQLIEDLLDMSRMITGHLRLDLRRVDLANVVRAALDAVRPAAQAKGLLIGAELDPGVGPVLGDADRLQQVVWNLLTNSVKFTPKGGRIDVALAVAGSDAVLRVTDTGIGIAADLLPYVFERFRQGVSSPSRAYGGLGIGLALVRHLTEMHGGTVMAESDGPDRGSTFTVRIPVLGTRAVAEQPVISPRDAPEDAVGGALDGLTVLVVDDDEDARDLISTALQHEGARVVLAASAREAVEILAGTTPNVVVSDIAMPNGTGYDLAKQIRSTPHLAALPAIALTAYGRVEDRERALSAGFNFHIVKPVEPVHLVQAVAAAAGRE